MILQQSHLEHQIDEGFRTRISKPYLQGVGLAGIHPMVATVHDSIRHHLQPVRIDSERHHGRHRIVVVGEGDHKVGDGHVGRSRGCTETDGMVERVGVAAANITEILVIVNHLHIGTWGAEAQKTIRIRDSVEIPNSERQGHFLTSSNHLIAACIHVHIGNHEHIAIFAAEIHERIVPLVVDVETGDGHRQVGEGRFRHARQHTIAAQLQEIDPLRRGETETTVGKLRGSTL